VGVAVEKSSAAPHHPQTNGIRLGWLIEPQTRRVEIYRPDQEVEILNNPATLSGETVLPGCVGFTTRV
jgi:Uma2 family endonuclease